MTGSQPTRLMAMAALGLGAVGVLAPLAGMHTIVALLAVGAGVLFVFAVSVPETTVRAGSLAYLILGPAIGGAVLGAAFFHVEFAAIRPGVQPLELVRVAAGPLAGLAGATVLSILFAGAIGRLAVPSISSAFRAIIRVAGLFLVYALLSFGWTLLDIPVDQFVSAGVSTILGIDPHVLAVLVFGMAAIDLLYLERVSRRIVSLPRSPIADLTLNLDASDDAEETEPSNDEEPIGRFEGSRSKHPRDGTWFERKPLPVRIAVFALFVLALGRPTLFLVLTEVDHEVVPQLESLNEQLITVVGSAGLFRSLVLLLIPLFAISRVVGIVRWARRRYDKHGHVVGTNTLTVIVIGLIAIAIQLEAETVEPLVIQRLGAAGLPESLLITISRQLPAVLLGGIVGASVLGTIPFVLLLIYQSMAPAGGDGWLGYRNVVFMLSFVVAAMGAIRGVPALTLFVGIVAAILAWDFLEYGRTVTAEVRSRALQPPEISHALASVGFGAVVLGLTLGVYMGGLSYTPTSTLSYLVAPVVLLASVLLLFSINR